MKLVADLCFWLQCSLMLRCSCLFSIQSFLLIHNCCYCSHCTDFTLTLMQLPLALLLPLLLLRWCCCSVPCLDRVHRTPTAAAPACASSKGAAPLLLVLQTAAASDSPAAATRRADCRGLPPCMCVATRRALLSASATAR